MSRADVLRSLAALLRDRRTGSAAVLATLGFLLVVSVPTAMIDTPLFTREIPPTWWAWPALALSSVLGGLVIATYVRPVEPHADPEESLRQHEAGDRASGRAGTTAGVLTFFAVGCPVCNKLVLLALGAAGAVTWFQPSSRCSKPRPSDCWAGPWSGACATG